MKVITALLAVVTALLLLSDIIHGSATRHWRDGQAVVGMHLMRSAAAVNPLSVSVRLDQIESLFTGYRQTKNVSYLHEAVLISRGIKHDYPGSVQGRTLYAAARVLEATHGGDEYPVNDALDGVMMDPLSVDAIDNAMFLIAANRREHDYITFKWLGRKRAVLTHAKMPMVCALCGKHWLNH